MSRPYAFINEQMQTFMALKSALNLNSTTAAKFDTVNRHLVNQVALPGHMIIVPDATTALCTVAEAQLMEIGRNTAYSILAVAPRDDGAVVHNYDLMHALLSYSSLGVGSLAAP